MVLGFGGSGEVGSRVMRPASPGSRWWRGGMAFRVWVRQVAPADRAARPWA